MRILWLTNVCLPEANILMKEKPNPFGGWLINTSKDLSEQTNCELAISFPQNGIKDIKTPQGKKINYYAFPSINIVDVPSIEKNVHLKSILNEVKPDIVHIFGTEFAHTLAMVNVCNDKRIETVISIQGLVSVIAKQYVNNLPIRIQKRFTFRDFVKQDNILQQQKMFVKRGMAEVEAIKKTNHIIGRTTWDKVCTSQINPQAQYHFCNETLRGEFYKHKWLLENCEKYSIFISQASYPIKGLHYMLEAMPLILKRYPKTKLYIAGHNITKSDTLKEKMKKTSYAKYIEELIQDNNLKNNVKFTGILNEQQMCERYLKSNVFVCPSSIENSPNSLGEAMILGVPCVASDVGGVSDMLKHKEEGFVYQSDAPYMLAHYIYEIFEDDDLALTFSKNAREHALKTNDREENTKRLIEIYKAITSKE